MQRVLQLAAVNCSRSRAEDLSLRLRAKSRIEAWKSRYLSAITAIYQIVVADSSLLLHMKSWTTKSRSIRPPSGGYARTPLSGSIGRELHSGQTVGVIEWATW